MTFSTYDIACRTFLPKKAVCRGKIGGADMRLSGGLKAKGNASTIFSN
jgi:hypothetical protein